VRAERQHVCVSRRATNVERRQQHPALEHELLGEGRHGEPGQEGLVDVELEELLRIAPWERASFCRLRLR